MFRADESFVTFIQKRASSTCIPTTSPSKSTNAVSVDADSRVSCPFSQPQSYRSLDSLQPRTGETNSQLHILPEI